MTSTPVRYGPVKRRRRQRTETLRPRVERVYKLASSLHVVSGSGLEIAERAAEFRRATASQMGYPAQRKYLWPDEHSENATYFLIQFGDETIATSRVVTDEPLADLSATVLDRDHAARLQDLESQGNLGSIGRLWSSAGGELGAAAGWVTYRAFLLNGPAPRPFYVSEVTTVLRRRLLHLGVRCDTIGVTSIPQITVEPVQFDVHQIIVDVLDSDTGFARFLDDGLEIDLRGSS